MMPRTIADQQSDASGSRDEGLLPLLARSAFAILMGLACVPLASIVADLDTRYMIAVTAAAVALVALPLVCGPAHIRIVMAIGLSLGLSLALSISFLHHSQFSGRYVPFVAGAQAVTISLSLLATLGYWVAEASDRYLYGHRRRLRLCLNIVVPQLLFMLAGLLSLMNAQNATLVWLEELRLLTLLLATLVTVNFTMRELRAYMLTLAASVLLQAGLAMTQFATGRNLGLNVFGESSLIITGIDYSGVLRPTGTLSDPNILSYFFEITAPVMLALFYCERRTLIRLLFAAATLAAVAGALVTYSRAAWGTLPLTFAFVTIAVWGRRLISLRNAIVAIVVLAGLCVALVYAWPLIEKRLFGDDAGSGGRRLPLDLAAISVLAQFPIFGVGLNNLAISFTGLDPTHYSRVFRGGDHVVHNLHLLVWTEVGTIGLLPYLFLFGTVFVLAGKIRGDPWSRAVALSCAAGLAAHLLHGMVDPGFKISLTISYLVFAQIGIIGGLYLRDRAKRSRQHA